MTTSVTVTTPPLRRARRRRRAPWFLWAGAVAAAGASIIPLWYLLDRIVAGGGDAIRGAFGGGRLAHLVWASSSLAAVVGLTSALVGSATAWAVERVALPGGRLWHVLATVPLAVPSYVAAYAWVTWFPSLSGFWGAALVLTGVCSPIVHLSMTAGLVQLDRSQVEVARALGWSRWTIATRLTAPQLRRHLSSGVLLVVLYVLSDFGVVAVMRYEAFTWVIYGAYRAGFDPSRAAVLAGALVVLALLVVLAEAVVRGRRTAATVGARTVRVVPRLRTRPARLAAAGTVLGVAAVSLGVPIARAVAWTLSDIDEGVPLDRFGAALGTTVGLVAAATVATLAVAVPLAILVARHPSPAGHVLERSVYVAHSLPGIVMAISFVFVGVRLLRPLYLTTPLLIMAYVSLVASLAVGAARASAERIPRGLDEAARASGWSSGRVLRRITLPLSRGGILAGGALVALTIAKELPTTLLLRPTGMHTLATRTWEAAAVSDDATVGPYALALIALSVVPAAVLAARPDRSPS